MPFKTWQEVRDAFGSRRRITAQGPDWFRCDRGDQRLKIQVTQVLGRPAVLMTAEVCPQHRLDPNAAVQLNAELQIGSAAVADGMYQLRHVVLLDHLEADALVWMSAYLLVTAEAVRKSVTPIAIDATCFQAYAY